MVNIERWARVGRWFMAAWVAFALPSAVTVLQNGRGFQQLAIAAGIVSWAVVWIWYWFGALGHSRRAEVLGFLANLAVLTALALVAPQPVGVGGVLVFAFVVAGVAFPLRQAIWVFAALIVLQVTLQTLRLEEPALQASSIVNSVLVGVVGAGARLFWQSYKQLVAAREQLAHLAVTEERLRFARDLHDLLGQSLSVLVLKSELVAKQLPDDAGEPLRNEVRDIAHVARKSLDDVREAVAGYRRPTLQNEIADARQALRTAGIGLLVEDHVGVLPPDQDGVLAWCLREAVTNVVKHSGARRCEVRISRGESSAVLDVADDGAGATSFNGGSGLAGMRERVELVGGTLKVGNETGGGLHLRVSVPQPA